MAERKRRWRIKQNYNFVGVYSKHFSKQLYHIAVWPMYVVYILTKFTRA